MLDGGCQFQVYSQAAGRHWVKFTLKRPAGAPSGREWAGTSRGFASGTGALSSPPLWILWIPAFARMTRWGGDVSRGTGARIRDVPTQGDSRMAATVRLGLVGKSFVGSRLPSFRGAIVRGCPHPSPLDSGLRRNASWAWDELVGTDWWRE